jgi:hypothetical protein
MAENNLKVQGSGVQGSKVQGVRFKVQGSKVTTDKFRWARTAF